MGAWSASINGNDTAQDLKAEYKVTFSFYDTDTALEKIDSYVRTMFDESDTEEWCNYIYSLAEYAWKHGRLTDEIRSQAIQMIDSGFGLDIWAEEGSHLLNQRKKVLAELRAKLLSPQPPQKKIALGFRTKPVFETGDLVAMQIQTTGKKYFPYCKCSEDEFRSYNGYYVVLRKVANDITSPSSIVPEVKDYWAVFQIYQKLFDHCPNPNELEGVPFSPVTSGIYPSVDGTFICESSMLHFKRRKSVVIGRNLNRIPQQYNRGSFLFIGINSPYANSDIDLLNAVL